MRNQTHLPTTVKNLRNARGWTQATLADRAGVDQATVSLIESGENANPTSVTLNGLADALGVGLDKLFSSFSKTALANYQQIHKVTSVVESR